MVALALPFAYLHARAGGISFKVFGGIMLGISFVLLNNVAGHLGLLRDWTPWVAAATPSLLYLLLSMARVRLAGALPMTSRRPSRPDPVRPRRARPALGAPFEAVAARVRAPRPGARRCGWPSSIHAPDLPDAGAAAGRRRLHAHRRAAAVPGRRRPCAADLPLLMRPAARARIPAVRCHAARAPSARSPAVIDAMAAAARMAVTPGRDRA